MQISLTHRPSYAQAKCVFSRGDTLLVERDGMLSMSDGLRTHAGFGPGGLGKAVMRHALGGESLIMARYTAELENAWMQVAPRYPGDMEILDFAALGGRGVVVERGALIACTGPSDMSAGVDVDVKLRGLSSVLLREGLSMLRLSGDGLALIASYGGITSGRLRPGEVWIIDSGHLVGFTDNTSVTVDTLGGLTTSTLTGEGLVARVVGAADGGSIVWTQSRSEQGLRGWLLPQSSTNHSRD
jgi:uncharacterized protein (TIGR00266 family)